jgi:hypothetical protein
MRRFAKSVTGETWFAGSNPVLSASRKPLPIGEGFFCWCCVPSGRCVWPKTKWLSQFSENPVAHDGDEEFLVKTDRVIFGFTFLVLEDFEFCRPYANSLQKGKSRKPSNTSRKSTFSPQFQNVLNETLTSKTHLNRCFSLE